MGQTLGCLEKPAADAKPGEEGKHLLGEGGAVVAQPGAAPGAAADNTGSGDDGTEDDERDSDEAPPLVVLDAKDFGKRYKLKDVVGQGITSTVHICERLGERGSAPRRCACKLVNKRKLAADPSLREHLNEQLANEIGLLARLQHDNIVQLFDVYDSEDKMYIVMELMTGGELFDHIIDKGTLSEVEAAGVIKQVASALDYCHKHGVVHRDLKPENLLLGKGSSLDRVKIADFGFAKDWSGASMVSFIGTPGYLAPELRQGTSYTETVDVWALGVILFVLLSGRLPFAADTAPIPQGRAKALEHLKLEFPQDEFSHVSTSAKELMYHMLQLDPSARFTAQQVLEHPWVRGETASDTLIDVRARLKSLNITRVKKSGNYASFIDSPKAKRMGYHPTPRASDKSGGKDGRRQRKRSIYNETDDDANEHIVCSPTSQTLQMRRGLLRFAHFSQRGFDPDDMQRPNTDCFATVTNFNTDSEMAFFGVFDGHGESARACARFSRDQLQKRLARRLNKGAGFHTALRTAFSDTNELLHKSPIDDTMSGANAIVVVVRHGVLEIANVGDTRAILAEEESEGGEVKLVAKPLSTDQTAHRDDERARVKKCGARVLTMDQLEGLEDEGEENIRGLNRGEEIDTTGDPPRIWAEDGDYPGTVFTRSIGDSASERLGLVSDPELESCPLSPRTRFVVLASDGLFEFLTSQAVVDIVSQFDDPLDACRAVVSQAYSLWLQCEVRIDNITVICVFIEDVPEDDEEPCSPRTPRTMMAEAALSRPVRSGPSRAMRKRLSLRASAEEAQRVAEKAQNPEMEQQQHGAGEGGESAEPAYDPSEHAHPKSKKEMKRLERACKAIILFQNLSDEQRAAAFSVMERVDVVKGQRIIKQHTEGDCFYVIDAGDYDCRVDPEGTREDGGQVVHSYSGSGHFGELALMYSQPRAASVFCTSETGSLWKLEAAAFKAIIVPTSESLVRTLL